MQVTLITATDGAVVLTLDQALALEAASINLGVAGGGVVTVVATAAELQALSTNQLLALGPAGVTAVAASDALPVFSAAQMNAMGTAFVAVTAPPGNTIQNDGTATISGPAFDGMTFNITWDSSVASAPAGFKTDVKEAFQFYANTFNDSVPVYVDVGFGEVNGGALGKGALGESHYNSSTPTTYSALLAAMTANAASSAQNAALAASGSLPLTDPTGGASLNISDAEAQALGLLAASATSAQNIDGNVGYSDTAPFNYGSDPNQPSIQKQFDFFGTAEHEIAEVLGRVSNIDGTGPGPGATTTAYSPIDLFRYAAPGSRQFSATGTPGYFSIDDGTTNLGPFLGNQQPVSWHDHSTSSAGDLADWGGLPHPMAYTPDAFNDGSASGILNPFSASDAALINVLGYNLATPIVHPNLPPLAAFLYFDGNDSHGHNALWVANSSVTYATELTGVNGVAGNLVTAQYIATLGQGILFNGADLHGDNGLWVSNGTAGGTFELTGIANAASAAQGGLAPSGLTTAGNEVWFQGTDASGATGLWVSDDTPGGTHEIASGISAADITPYDGGVAFVGANGGVWTSDGSAGGTQEASARAGASLGTFLFPASDGTTGLPVPVSVSVPASGLSAYDLFVTPGGNLIFGGSYQYTLPGTSTPVVAQGLLNLSTGLISQTAPGPGGFASVGTLTYFEGMTFGTSLVMGLVSAGLEGAVWQTDGSVAGTGPSSHGGYDPTDLTAFNGKLLYAAQADLGVGPIPGEYPQVGNFVGATGSDLVLAPFSTSSATITTTGGTTIGFSGDGLDLSSPGNYFVFPAGAVNQVAYNPDVFSGVPTNQHGSGLAPAGITGFNGAAYFNGINAAGQHQLWSLAPGPDGTFDDSLVTSHIVGGGNLTASFLTATGTQSTGIAGASTAGLNPTNIAAIDIPRPAATAITVGQLAVDVAMDRITPGTGQAPNGLVYDVTDTAFDLESLTPEEIAAGKAIGLDGLQSTDTSIVLDAAQAEALEPMAGVSVPAGQSVRLIDDASAIEAMSATQLSELTTLGASGIAAPDNSVALTVAQVLALESPVLAGPEVIDLPVSVPAGDMVGIVDKAALIDTLTIVEIAGLAPIGVTRITANDSPIAISLSQALAFAGIATLLAPKGGVTASGTAAAIQTLTVAQINGLAASGITTISATDGGVVLQPYQALALLFGGIAVTAPSPATVTIAHADHLTAAAIAALTTAQIAAIVADGYTSIAATDGSVQLSSGTALAIAAASLGLTVPVGDTVTVADNPFAIEVLSPVQIGILGTLGVTALVPTSFSQMSFGVDQARALEAASIKLTPQPGKPLIWQIDDTAAQVQTLTPSQISGLSTVHAIGQINVLSNAITLTIDQVTALEAAAIGLGVLPFGHVTIAATAAQIVASPVSLFSNLPFNSSPISFTLNVTSGPVALTAAQLQALQSAGLLTGLTLPAGAAITISDIAVNLQALLASGVYPSLTAGLPLRALVSTDGSVGLTVQAAEALEKGVTALSQAIPVTAPAGHDVILQDIAAAIEGMPAAQLGALTAYGLSAVVVTDQSLVLTVAQALALFDPLPISVPAGASVIISDNEAAIDSLTPDQIVGLAAIGVTGVDVSTLTGAAPLTIDAGITLTVGGAAPSNETIDFTGSGGVLALGDTAATAATIDGFSPPDTIDLTDIQFDAAGTASLQSGNTLQIVENGTAYDLQLDPAQVFLTQANFVLNPDTGKGSLLTVTEAPVTGFFSVSSGQTVNGLVVQNGGEVEVAAGAVSNRGTVAGGGEILGDQDATINDTVIGSDGLLDLNGGSSGTGTISFGPAASISAGGTLEVDDTTPLGATIAGFVAGDRIDLTAIPHANTDTATLLSGDTLQLMTSAGIYDLQLSHTDNFTNDYFYLSYDATNDTGIGIINESVPRTLIWTGAQDGDFSDAMDWDDTTTNLDPAPLAPDRADTAVFVTGGGTIAGVGAAGAFQFGGPTQWQLGAATQLTAAGASGVTVGQGGSGLVSLSNGATLISQGSTDIVSGGLPSEASVLVTGSTSTWTSHGELEIGGEGLGVLAIQAGGTVTAGAGLLIADAAGASGSSVEVNGTGSGLTVTGPLSVGVAGSGALELSNGATVTAGSLDAGIIASAVANIDVTDASFAVSGDATVADDGTGVLSVLSGATFSAGNLTIGSQGDSSGAVVVSGAGSVINIAGNLNVGTALGTGDLTIGPGGAVHAKVVSLQGQVVLENGFLDPTVNLINQGQTAGGSGTIAAGDIVDEGLIQAGGSKPSQKLLVVSGTVLGGGPWTINGTAQAQANGGAGILQINAGGTLELTGPVLNAASTTFTDDVTPQSTYSVTNSVIDVNFGDATGVLKLDAIAGFAGTIVANQKGDSFVITGGTLSGLGVSNGNTLTVSDSGNGGTDTIIFASAVSAGGFSIVNSNTIQVACFAAGTRIGLENGSARVEDLCVGDHVVTADRRAEPIVWIGQRTVNCQAHSMPETVWPVLVSAGAFGVNGPARDLYLSPDHAVFVNDVLIPVKLLINGTSIVQVKRSKVTYYHVELKRHEVILAEGLSVESYLDTGDRTNFQQDGTTIQPSPDFAARLAPDTALVWETKGVARLVMAGETLADVRLAIAKNVQHRNLGPVRRASSTR